MHMIPQLSKNAKAVYDVQRMAHIELFQGQMLFICEERARTSACHISYSIARN